MSWVLILTSNYHQRPPAVIGGYATRGEAEEAGFAACRYDMSGTWPVSGSFNNFTVIAGAACSEPSGVTTYKSDPEHGDPPRINSYLFRWPEGASVA